LRQILNEPNDRIYLGDFPDKLVHFGNNKTKYIDSLSIKRIAGSSLPEVWFNNTLKFNPGLVAIIGNKGKGKSALSDIIGLLCNTKQSNEFTFLSKKNFRQERNNKAKHFEAQLVWASGDQCSMSLDDNVDPQRPELVKYLPQNFLENICNQLSGIEESEFDQELKKVIFSHVDPADRMDIPTLDELLSYKTSEAYRKIEILKQELHDINKYIVSVEDWLDPENKQRISNLLDQKNKELDIHLKAHPKPVNQPDTDKTKQKEIADVSSKLQDEISKLNAIEKHIIKQKEDRKAITKHITITKTLISRLDNIEHQIQGFIRESESDLNKINLKLDNFFTFNINREPLNNKLDELSSLKVEIDRLLNPSVDGSLENQKQYKLKSIESLKKLLDEPNKKYQAYLTDKSEWEKRKSSIIGNRESDGTIEYYKHQLKTFEKLPQSLKLSQANRLEKSLEIYAVKKHLSNTYRELYHPIHDFIDKKSVTIQDYQLNFEVGIVDSGFEKDFFHFISHGLAGTYCGAEEGKQKLRETLKTSDFSTPEGIKTFLEKIIKTLQTDIRPGGGEIKIKNQLRKDREVLSLYDMIFSLDFLKPRYSFRMGDKELNQLSPGERGTLLLIFYLLLDKSDTPLIIDQPEENLDNQTVYEVLVPCIKEAKQQRQLIMVTHNPNLAVVCDAEQIIRADLDKKNNYVMKYNSGAIENPDINRSIVDVLEGTMPAFDNRESKYIDQV
jgi:ABC-type lipoprotein export system ATPase subunit